MCVETYRSFPETLRPPLWADAMQLSGANGSHLVVYGRVEVTLEVGGIGYPLKVIIANLAGIQAILGMPFLTEHQCTLRLAQGQMVSAGATHQLTRLEQQGGACLQLQERVSILKGRQAEVTMTVLGPGPLGNQVTWYPDTALTDSMGVLVHGECLHRGGVNYEVGMRNMGNGVLCFLAGTILGHFGGKEGAPMEGTAREVSTEELTVLDPFEQLVQRACEDMEGSEKEQVGDMLRQNAELFVGPNNPLGQTSLVEHEIHTRDARPIRQPLRRMAPAHWEIAEKAIEKMLREGVIERSVSPWSSPVVLVKKTKTGEMRFCVDLRALNEVTTKDSYALTNIQECLETLYGARYFCTMDLASGYWQVMLRAEDREKTAFPTKKGLFQFRTMAFGLCNAPATFQRLMERVLTGLQYVTCHVYLDDIVVFGRSLEETLGRLQQVFNRLRAAGLKLKPSKCSFFQREVLYLGHVIGANGVACDHDKIEAVKNWVEPRNAYCMYRQRVVL